MSTQDTKKVFTALLAEFVKTTRQSMDSALLLSHMAIQHFEAHGNLSYAQDFLNAMSRNYNRLSAFLEWMQEFSPVSVEGSLKTGYTLTKDKGPDAKPFDLDKALATPYWEFSPPKEEINFGFDDVMKAMKNAIAKFRKGRYHAASDMAVMALQKADIALLHLEADIRETAAKTPANINDDNDDDIAGDEEAPAEQEAVAAA